MPDTKSNDREGSGPHPPDDADPRLIVEVGQKQVSYSLPPHTVEQLHNLTGKRR